MGTVRKLVMAQAAALLALLAGLSNAAAPAAGQAMQEVLGAGDTVRVTAYRYPDLTTEGRLSEEGKLNLPLIGEVALQGMTPQQAASHIADELKRGKYLLNPQIGVTVLQARSRQVSVLGLVARPGRYVLDGATARLSDVIAMAGGLDEKAADTVTVQRNHDGANETVSIDLASVMQEGDMSKNIELRSGDSVFVPRAPVFYIYGEVERGGAYRLEPDMTVTQAIALAGGITPRGSERRLQVRRKAPDGKWRVSSVRLLDRVSADDVIFVRESLF